MEWLTEFKPFYREEREGSIPYQQYPPLDQREQEEVNAAEWVTSDDQSEDGYRAYNEDESSDRHACGDCDRSSCDGGDWFSESESETDEEDENDEDNDSDEGDNDGEVEDKDSDVEEKGEIGREEHEDGPLADEFGRIVDNSAEKHTEQANLESSNRLQREMVSQVAD